MKRVIQFGVIFILIPVLCFGQKKQKKSKPALLVYGNTIEAAVIAIQSAQSNVPTVWVRPESKDGIEEELARLMASDQARFASGVLSELIHLKDSSAVKADSSQYREAGTVLHPALQRYLAYKVPQLEQWLTVVSDVSVRTASGGKASWKIQLDDRRAWQVKTVVDGSYDGELNRRLGRAVKTLSDGYTVDLLSADVQTIKTSLAFGNKGNKRLLIPLRSLVSETAEDNFFSIAPFAAKVGLTDNLALRASHAQALAAVAAYITFFKTSLDGVALRVAQDELLRFGLKLLYFDDLAVDDKYYTAIQRVVLSGLFAGKDDGGVYNFRPGDGVFVADVRERLVQMYSRSQLWLGRYDQEQFRLGEALSLIKYVSKRGDEVNAKVKAGWSDEFGFVGAYDEKKPISRYQFAVLLDRYANPFGVKIDNEGKLIN